MSCAVSWRQSARHKSAPLRSSHARLASARRQLRSTAGSSASKGAPLSAACSINASGVCMSAQNYQLCRKQCTASAVELRSNCCTTLCPGLCTSRAQSMLSAGDAHWCLGASCLFARRHHQLPQFCCASRHGAFLELLRCRRSVPCAAWHCSFLGAQDLSAPQPRCTVLAASRADSACWWQEQRSSSCAGVQAHVACRATCCLVLLANDVVQPLQPQVRRVLQSAAPPVWVCLVHK